MSTPRVDTPPVAPVSAPEPRWGVFVAGGVLSTLLLLYLVGLLLAATPGGPRFPFLIPALDEARMQVLWSAVSDLDAPTAQAALEGAGGSRRGATEHGTLAAQATASLAELTRIFPAGSEGAKATAQASAALNTRLALEKQAVAHGRNGRRDQARALLTGTRYQAARAAVRRAGERLESVGAEYARRETQRRQGLRMKASGVVLLGLAGLWFLNLWSVRNVGAWRRLVEARLREKERLLGEHQSVRSHLEERLREREAELSQVREALEQQITLGQRADTRANRLESAVESTNDVVMICEAAPGGGVGRLLYVNPAFERMTGYTREELALNSPRILQGPRTDTRTLAFLRSKLNAYEPVRVELINYRKDGSEFWVELNIQPLFDKNGLANGWMSIQRDITERKVSEERIQYQATHDALTGLPNRYLYEQRLEEALVVARARNVFVGVLFFDLDRFKQVNDTLGHPAGDKLLQEVARRLQHYLTAGEIVARMGGDEFTILLPHIESQEQAEAVARKLLEAMDSPFDIDGRELFVTASIGISIAPRDGTDITALLKNADVAMYRAKEEGRDSYRIFSQTMVATGHDRLVLDTHLRKAMEQDEIFLLYQPQLDLRSGEVMGVEALVRWENPQLGRISPGEFIPLAEETGLIVSMGEYILREACRQAAKWYRSGKPLRVSVNISPRQLEEKDLVERVAEILAENELPAEWLDIEMTERMLVRGERVAEALRGLKRLGVRLSVDDFGTGYSSFSYLHTFPLDVLKVDRSFVTSLGEDLKSEAMVRYLVELAHAVGLEVIAEGVETEQQKSVLMDLNCDAIQGYLLSPATSPREVEALAQALLNGGAPVAAAGVVGASRPKGAPGAGATGGRTNGKSLRVGAR